MAESGGTLWGYNKQQWLIFLILAFVNLFAGLVYSIQAPFYPKEAESKGATASAYGFVLGVYELVNFLFAPVFGAYMDKLGPINVFHIGTLVSGAMTVAFGFLRFVNGATMFIVLSFVIRITQAMGGTAIITSSVTVVAIEFASSVATTFAAIETFWGVGFCVGPTIGAGLFELGGEEFGFPLPFIVMGCLLVICVPTSLCVLWRHKMTRPSHDLDFSMSVELNSGLWSFLKVPAVELYVFSAFATSIALGFLSALLEPHLRQFNLNPVQLGLMFLLYGGTYALFAPLWGMLCDRISKPKWVTLVGSILVFSGFILIGPAPFVPIDSLLWLTSTGLVLFGLGCGGIYVSSFILSLQAARENGFANDLPTYGMVCGVWRSSVALGSFLGPSLAGVLYDFWGFRNETIIILALQGMVVILVILFLIFEKPRRRRYRRPQNAQANERTPILPKESPNPLENSMQA